jgi:hypothetical protein
MIVYPVSSGKMIVYPVSSGNIERIGYDQEMRHLLVQFHSGQWYVYDFVPVDVFGELLAAESVGKSFNVLVKQGGFPYRKVDVDFEPIESNTLGVATGIRPEDGSLD